MTRTAWRMAAAAKAIRGGLNQWAAMKQQIWRMRFQESFKTETPQSPVTTWHDEMHDIVPFHDMMTRHDMLTWHCMMTRHGIMPFHDMLIWHDIMPLHDMMACHGMMTRHALPSENQRECIEKNTMNHGAFSMHFQNMLFPPSKTIFSLDRAPQWCLKNHGGSWR